MNYLLMNLLGLQKKLILISLHHGLDRLVLKILFDKGIIISSHVGAFERGTLDFSGLEFEHAMTLPTQLTLHLNNRLGKKLIYYCHA